MVSKARKERKRVALEAGKEALEELVAMDYQVEELAPYHFRINGHLDVWPSTGRWWDTRLGVGGKYGDIKKLVTKMWKHTKETPGT